jgi:prepilin-type N-terminal cleavage/methylation domain-containing protein
MKRTRPRRQGGFTLAEVLVTLALLAIVMVLLVFPMFSGFAYVEQGVARGDAQAAGRAAMDAMARELAEAIYVFDIPPGGDMIAFVLPVAGDKRAAPPGPQVTSTCSRYEAPVRYWRVLTRYLAQVPWRASEVVARTAPQGEAHEDLEPQNGCCDPAEPYEDLNGNGVWDSGEPYDDLNGNDTYDSAGEPFTDVNGNGLWDSPMARALDTTWPDPSYNAYYSLGDRNTGMPRPSGLKAMDSRYSGGMTSLTPSELGFEVPVLNFRPEASEGETLQPVTTRGREDYSVRSARWGAWQQFRQGRDPDDPLTDVGRIAIFRRPAPNEPYALRYHTRVNPANGRVEIVEHLGSTPADHSQDSLVFDTDKAQPLKRDPSLEPYGFRIDRQAGQMLFWFPQPAYPAAETLLLAVPEGETEAEATLAAKDPDGPGEDYSPDPLARIVPGSESVMTLDGKVLQRVSGTQPLKPGQYSIDYEACTIRTNANYVATGPTVTYRWRNNPPDDLVKATYYTKSIITISLTTAKRFNMGRQKDRLEGYHAEAQVKLRNLAR